MPLIDAHAWLQRDTDVLAKALSRKDAQPRPLATLVSSRRQAVYHDLPRSYAQIEHSVFGIWERAAEGAPPRGEGALGMRPSRDGGEKENVFLVYSEPKLVRRHSSDNIPDDNIAMDSQNVPFRKLKVK